MSDSWQQEQRWPGTKEFSFVNFILLNLIKIAAIKHTF